MIYSTTEGSPFWFYVERANRGTWSQVSRSNNLHNQTALRRFPEELWAHIFQYVFSWKLPAMRWARICSVCKEWNLRGESWKKTNLACRPWMVRGDVLTNNVAELQPLGFAKWPYCDIYIPQTVSQCERVYKVLRRFRGHVTRHGAPPVPKIEHPLPNSAWHMLHIDPRCTYAQWWKQWGRGPIINHSVAQYAWTVERGSAN